MDINTLSQEINTLHADFCSALVDPTRMLILYVLDERPRNVTELSQELKAPQPSVSRHLKILRDRGVVLALRQGTTVIYSLADRRVIEALDILRTIMRERVQFQASLVNGNR
jgi:DNA-binding transcriptional ArsR family regulator